MSSSPWSNSLRELTNMTFTPERISQGARSLPHRCCCRDRPRTRWAASRNDGEFIQLGLTGARRSCCSPSHAPCSASRLGRQQACGASASLARRRTACQRGSPNRAVGKWLGFEPIAGATGVPLIPGALAHFECERYAVHDGGDHLIFVGRVLALGRPAGLRPLARWSSSPAATIRSIDLVKVRARTMSGFCMVGNCLRFRPHDRRATSNITLPPPRCWRGGEGLSR